MAGCILMGLQFQLERSQWLSAGTIRALQLRQIKRLVAHAYRTVPYYKEAFAAAGVVATDHSRPIIGLRSHCSPVSRYRNTETNC
jgi:phenylacetate-coenzyme A ligase PaaK-like adenylate-forming protein